MWEEIHFDKLSALEEARMNLHFAVQPLASAGEQLAKKKADFSHTSLEYNPHHKAFISAKLESPVQTKSVKDLHVGLEIESLTLFLLSCDQERLAEKSLIGSSLSGSLAWLSDQLRENGVENPDLVFPQYPEFPKHPLKESALFQAPELNGVSGARVLHQFYRNTYFILDAFIQNKDKTSPIRIWPHHFDMASLITLKEDASIGVGFSPGDDNYNEPYWYVSPWPYPDKSSLPQIGSLGFWHTEGFIAAILLSNDLYAKSDHEEEGVKKFIRENMESLLKMMDTE